MLRNRSLQGGMKPASCFKIAAKPVTSYKMLTCDEVDENKIKTVVLRNAALHRILRSGKFSYNLLMKLIRIKENSEIHKNRIKKLRKIQEKYSLMIRRVQRKTSVDTDLELDLESLTNLREPDDSYNNRIKGNYIFDDVPDFEKVPIKPILFQTEHVEDPKVILQPESIEPVSEKERGVIRYKLSDRTFIDKGWTKLPIEKVVQKKNVYRVVPAHPEFDWFKNNKDKGPIKYETGEKLAEFDDNGRGRWFYKNGRVALRFYDCEEANAQQRYLVYSSGEPDDRGRSRPVTLLAMFDFLGNGVVFDHAGKIRIKYNQSEGVVLDRGIGPVSHWKWHSLNDPPILQRVMMDTYIEKKDPDIMNLPSSDDKKPRPDFDEMLEIEFGNSIKDQTKKLAQKFKPYQIKMKVLKINEQFSLRIIDQANVHLNFRDGSVNFKLNLGMIVDNHQIIRTETEDLGDVTVSLDKTRDQSESIIDLQKSLQNVFHIEQARFNRESKIRPIVPKASIDCFAAAASKPLGRALRTVKSKTSNVSCECSYHKKLSQPNLYYNNRLL